MSPIGVSLTNASHLPLIDIVKMNPLMDFAQPAIPQLQKAYNNRYVGAALPRRRSNWISVDEV
jgi:hypothetical protein